MRTFLASLLVLFALPALAPVPALAQDPPGRVGRLSYMEGQVSARTPDQQDWQPADLNYPVTTGQSFWTDQGSKAELQIGGTEVRLDEGTQIAVTRLDDSAAQFDLAQGAANIHVHNLPQGGLNVHTPKGDVTVTQPGTYSIDVADDQSQVEIAALEGQARFKGPRGALDIQAGENATVAGDPPNISFDQAEANDFDNWALAREKREQTSAALQHVSPQMTGYQDLDRYGSWQAAPEYGQVWYPTTVTPDWQPYRYGHWANVRPWGWTWIDDAPWGFAPFHYGRWVRVGPRWAWWPGAVAQRPVYAPALVAFVGGNGFEVSVSIGGTRPAVGWIPLAPHEVFRPAYRVSPTYVRNVNVTTVNKTVINNITVNNTKNVTVNKFVNRDAVTTVSRDDFARGAKVQQAKVEVTHDRIEKGRVNDINDVRKIQPQRAEAKSAAVEGKSQPQAEPHRFETKRTEQRQAIAKPAEQPKQAEPKQIEQRKAEPPRQSQPQAQPQRAEAPKPQPKHAEAPRPQPPRPQQTTQLRPTPEGWHREPRAEPQQHQQAQPQQQKQQVQQQPQQREQQRQKRKDERPDKNG